MPALTIRQYGDPVLKERAREVEEIDGARREPGRLHGRDHVRRARHGAGGQPDRRAERVFVYDIGEGVRVVINPSIVESAGEWVYEEGCLSVPGLSWPIVRPNEVHLVGLDLDGNEVSVEAIRDQGRVFQHELDHLDGILLMERLDEEQRKEALKILRAQRRPPWTEPRPPPDGLAGLFARWPTRSMARLAYLGTPEMAVPPLRALATAGHEVALCVTRPDRRRGRGGKATPSPVKEAATELGIPVTDDLDQVADVHADLAVVVAYGRIIPSRLLEDLPWSTCTSHCCHGGAAPRRSNAPSSPATPRPACA